MKNDTKQGISSNTGKVRNKCKTKEQTKHNEKQKKPQDQGKKSLLDFISLSFRGLPKWRCCPKP
jgi:hypothetical protein